MPGNPLYFVRIAQLLFGIGFLILVADASVHRGWWNNINGAVALGGRLKFSLNLPKAHHTNTLSPQ